MSIIALLILLCPKFFPFGKCCLGLLEHKAKFPDSPLLRDCVFLSRLQSFIINRARKSSKENVVCWEAKLKKVMKAMYVWFSHPKMYDMRSSSSTCFPIVVSWLAQVWLDWDILNRSRSPVARIVIVILDMQERTKIVMQSEKIMSSTLVLMFQVHKWRKEHYHIRWLKTNQESIDHSFVTQNNRDL